LQSKDKLATKLQVNMHAIHTHNYRGTANSRSSSLNTKTGTNQVQICVFQTMPANKILPSRHFFDDTKHVTQNIFETSPNVHHSDLLSFCYNCFVFLCHYMVTIIHLPEFSSGLTNYFLQFLFR